MLFFLSTFAFFSLAFLSFAFLSSLSTLLPLILAIFIYDHGSDHYCLLTASLVMSPDHCNSYPHYMLPFFKTYFYF